MAEFYLCPANGCDYSGVKKSVIAHHSGSTDHTGGYMEAKQAVENADAIGDTD